MSRTKDSQGSCKGELELQTQYHPLVHGVCVRKREDRQKRNWDPRLYVSVYTASQDPANVQEDIYLLFLYKPAGIFVLLTASNHKG